MTTLHLSLLPDHHPKLTAGAAAGVGTMAGIRKRRHKQRLVVSTGAPVARSGGAQVSGWGVYCYDLSLLPLAPYCF